MVGKAVEHLLGRDHHAPLAAYIGVAPSGISRRLKGETRWDAAEVVLVAEFFDKPVAMLYTDWHTWAPRGESLNVHCPPTQGSLLFPNLEPAFNFPGSAAGFALVS